MSRQIATGAMSRLTIAAVSAALLLPGFQPTVARAEWKPWGVALCTAYDKQLNPAIAPDGSGGAIVAWMDNRAGLNDIYVQRVADDGTPLWATDGVAVCTAPDEQRFPFITSDNAGGAIITWKDARSGEFDVYAQRVDASGQVQWASDGIPVCTADHDQIDTEIVSDGGNGAIIVWRDFRGGGQAKLYAQKLDGSGQKMWTASGVLVSTASTQYNASAIPDGSGGAVLAWFDYRNAQFDIYAQRLTAQGALAWPGTGVPLCTAPGNQMYPRMTTDGAGGGFVTWYDYRSGIGYDIYAQHVTANGTLSPGWPGNGVAVCTAPNDQAEPVLVPDGQNGALITWYDNRSTVAIYAQHLTAAGQIAAGWPANGRKLCTSPATRPAIMPDGFGGALVAYQGTPGNTNLDVSVQRVAGTGQIPDGWPSDGLYLCTAPGDQSRPVGIALPGGDALIAWSDARGDGGDIYVTRVAAAFPNLNADAPPAGFALPIVPRNATGATLANAVPTATLDGDLATTRLNWVVSQEGAATVPSWTGRVLLDGVPLRTVTFSGNYPGGLYSVLNDGPVTVPGGRHTLTLEADCGNVIPESSEADNVWSAQFVWSPRSLAPGTGRLSAAPPARGNGSVPNLDGYAFTPAPGRSWVCALAPVESADDYDLALFDDYSGSQAGFSHEVEASNRTGGVTEFVVGPGTASPAALYPAALTKSAGAGAGYAVNVSDATGHLGAGSLEQWVEQVMPANRIAEVYEADFTAGVTYHMNLLKKWGAGNLAFSVFPAGPGGPYGPGDAIAVSIVRTAPDQDVDVLDFTAPVTGRYPIVLYRQTGEGLEDDLTYHFFWNSAISGVGDETGPAVLAFPGAWPNPMRNTTRLSFSVPGDGAARLQVYDVTGRLVRSLVDGPVTPGSHEVVWDGRSSDGSQVASGMYWARLETGGRALTRRVVVVP